MALATLEEVAAHCRQGAQPQTRGLAMALAYLAHVAEPPDRSWFDRFWRCVKNNCHVTRPAEASASLNGIYIAVGRTRELSTISFYERAARRER
jgi:hypothetical protein